MSPVCRLILLALGAGLPLAGQANNLLSAYQLAQERDPVLRAADYQRATAVEVVPQARAQFLPQLNGTAGILRERQVFQNVAQDAGTNGGQGGSATSDATQRVYGDVKNYGLVLTQTLWSFQDYHLLKEADLQAAEAQAKYLGAQQALILRVTQAYFGILAAADQVATAQSQRDAFGDLLKQAQVRAQTGLSARTDVADAQSFYDATEETLIDAQNALEDAKRGFAEIVGQYPETVAPMQDDIPLTPPSGSVDDWASASGKENFDVRAAGLAAEAAGRDVKAQWAKYYPNLSLQGTAARLQQDLAFGGDNAVDSVGLVVNWPIFQGGAVQSQVRQSKAAYEVAKAQLDLAQRDAERQSRLAYRSVSSGVGRIEAARRAMESGRAATEASRLGVGFGTRTVFDLLNSQTNYFAAVRAYKQSRYDYLTAVLQLKLEAGRLQQADLERIDSLLMAGSATPPAPAAGATGAS